MKPPTLDEFIRAYGTRRYPTNLWVRERGFRSFYARVTRRFIYVDYGAYFEPCLDIANIEAIRPGRGTFTRLVERVRREYPAMPIYVESVLSQRFRDKLLRMGFVCVNSSNDSFALMP